MGGRSHHSMISLAPLNHDQVQQMVGELAARHALPKEIVDGVTERTGGVPLFVEEVTRLLLERGEQSDIQAIPPTLQQSLMARTRPARPGARGGADRFRDRTRLLLCAASRRSRNGRCATASCPRPARRCRSHLGAGPAARCGVSLQARALSGRSLRELAEKPALVLRHCSSEIVL